MLWCNHVKSTVTYSRGFFKGTATGNNIDVQIHFSSYWPPYICCKLIKSDCIDQGCPPLLLPITVLQSSTPTLIKLRLIWDRIIFWMRDQIFWIFLRSFVPSLVLNQGIRPSRNKLIPKETIWPTQTAWRDTVWERRKAINLLFTPGGNCIKRKMDIQSASNPSKQITMENTD